MMVKKKKKKMFINHIVQLSRESKAGSQAGLKMDQETVGGAIDLKFRVCFWVVLE